MRWKAGRIVAHVLQWLTVLLTHRTCLTQNTDVSLHVENSGPAVMDSSITFSAELRDSHMAKMDPKLYIYRWKENATFISIPEETTGGKNSTLNKSFHEFASAGKHVMDVQVYPKDNRTLMIAKGQTVFDLTDNLNVKFDLNQVTGVMMPPNTFSTKRNINMTVKVLDKFVNAKYNYTWRNNDSSVTESGLPYHTVLYNTPGQYQPAVNISGLVYYEEMDVLLSSTKKGAALDYITLKDSVTNITYSGPDSIEKGNILVANVTCDGSAPYTICVNVSGAEGWNESRCVSLPQNCYLPLNLSLPTPGLYTLHLTASNDVSIFTTSLNATVLSPGSAESAFVPVACVLIALSVVIALAVSYRHDKKHTSSMETADFDFTFLSSHQSTITMQHAKEFFQRAALRGKEMLSALKTKVISQPRQHSYSALSQESGHEYQSINVV